LEYVNCGHNAPVFKTGGEFKHFGATSIGLGMLPELPKVTAEKHAIYTNDVLLGYTDGLVEVNNAEGDYFEIEGIEQHLLGSTAKDVCHSIESAANNFRGECLFNDDVAILAICWK
jgi:sigma-B regulation protein RsbU (phosphoserine phosphatase)